jgi:hypothetical protein
MFQISSSLQNRLLILLSFCSFAFLACDDGSNQLAISKSPLINYNPSSFNFSLAPIGTKITSFVKVENLGAGLLRMRAFRINSESNEFSLSVAQSNESDAMLTALPDEIQLATNESTYIALSYERQNEGNDEGTVTFATNDANQQTITLPIITGLNGPQLRVDPNNIVFDSVEAGQSATQTVTLSNTSVETLVIYDLKINGSTDFTVSMDGAIIDTHPLATPIEIPSDAPKQITITYQPLTSGPDLGELAVTSNDGAFPNYAVPITANGAQPCIQVTPDFVDFGSGLLTLDRNMPTVNKKVVLIESCGNIGLQIHKIEIQGDEFGLTMPIEEIMPGVIANLPAVASDGVFPNTSVELGFWPLVENIYSGKMLIYSNASADPLSVDLIGRGVENACPVPISSQESYDVQPLDIITLDGSTSVDQGGQVVRWVWEVVERPNGSVSQIVERLTSIQDPAGGGDVDDDQTPTAIFFVDLAGRYTLQLKVYDNLGQESCDPKAVATVSIDAIPKKDLHIQLVWSTPEDPDETDRAGTDVDLHFKHQNAENRWASSAQEWDCYFNNKTPDWGRLGDILDNPSLDIDDTNGAGPENVNLNEPEEGVTYEIGAIYYRAESSFGSDMATPGLEHLSYVTVRVYVKGELLGEFTDKELQHLNDLWSVTKIEWCADISRCPVITPTDMVYADGEYAN